MAPYLKIDKFKGDNSQNVDTWLSIYKQYCSFYEGHAKIWYDTIPDSQKTNFDHLITLFKNRFKDKQHLLDLIILKTHQGGNGYVLDYDTLLSVAMNGLKSDLKTIVMTKEPQKC